MRGDGVIKHFSPVPSQPNKKCKTYRCKYCNANYAKNVTRMTVHLRKKCRACPDTVRKLFKAKKSTARKRKRYSTGSSGTDNSFIVDSVSDEVRPTLGDNENDVSTRTPLSNHEQPAKFSVFHSDSQQDISKYCDSMNQRQLEYLQELLATAIYASGSPLTLTENPYWQEFFKAIRPKFSLPSRYEISTPLLEKVHKKIKHAVEEKITSAPAVGLQCDGWSNVRNEGIINFIITTPSPVLYKTLPTKTSSHTAKYMADKMTEVIEEIGEDKVFGLSTDNATAMKASWGLIQKKFDWISPYGCFAHILNLLMKDIGGLSSVKSILDEAVTIVREIKNGHILLALFREVQGADPKKVKISLKLPVKTRFGSNVHCTESLLLNKHNLRSLAVLPKAEEHWDHKVSKSIILSDEFWISLQKIHDLLRPIATCITKLEGDQPLLSHVPETIHFLQEHFNRQLKQKGLQILTSEEIKGVFAALSKRKTMALGPIHFAANLLDPTFKGKRLSEEENVRGTELIYNLAKKLNLDCDAVLREFTDYKLNGAIWSAEYIQRASLALDARDWWRGFCERTALSKIAIAILSLVPTTAPTERSFSTQGWQHDAKRNRLHVDRAGKLTYISHNLHYLKRGEKKSKKKSVKNKLSITSIDGTNEGKEGGESSTDEEDGGEDETEGDENESQDIDMEEEED